MPSDILVIEDDPGIARIVTLYLERDGHRVTAAGDGLSGLRAARESNPDLIVLDLMLPRLDGMAVCRAIREESDVPIIMATARADEEDRLAGLDLGADDYIVKPFSPRELAARVRAVLRRSARQTDAGPSLLEYGDMTLDLKTRNVPDWRNQTRPDANRVPPAGHAGRRAGPALHPRTDYRRRFRL